MVLIHLIFAVTCIYIAGQESEQYKNNKQKKSLYWSIFSLMVGLVNILAMIELASK
jgi:hypothetical protein